MNDAEIIPRSYQQWRECITVRCGVPLTRSFVTARLEELRNPKHPKTSEFAQKYGSEYLQQVISWFEQAERSAS